MTKPPFNLDVLETQANDAIRKMQTTAMKRVVASITAAERAKSLDPSIRADIVTEAFINFHYACNVALLEKVTSGIASCLKLASSEESIAFRAMLAAYSDQQRTELDKFEASESRWCNLIEHFREALKEKDQVK